MGFKWLRLAGIEIILGACAVGIFFTCILGASLWNISAHSKDIGKTVSHTLFGVGPQTQELALKDSGKLPPAPLFEWLSGKWLPRAEALQRVVSKPAETC